MARVLVIGGAGYVGSSVRVHLEDHGHDVHVLDNLSSGHRDWVDPARLTVGDAGDARRVADLLGRIPFDVVMHFAAKCIVEESFTRAAEYHETNVTQTRALLDAMLEGGRRRFIFSSSATVYGDPGAGTLNEDAPKRPLNPYGTSKLAAEDLIRDYAERRGLRAIVLRYFNAAGAEPKLRVGERHVPESHLIPRILDGAARGEPVEVYGNDYPTADGSCVRDFVHVSDLASAHEMALKRLLAAPAGDAGSWEAFNLGSGSGSSVLQILEVARKVTGVELRPLIKPRRKGEPATLVADVSRAGKVLGWTPRSSDLPTILASAWAWQRQAR